MTPTGSLDDVRELRKRFESQIFGFSMVAPQFECVVAFKKDFEAEVYYYYMICQQL
jgi:hypothetical protein